jgi:hypothetical protein
VEFTSGVSSGQFNMQVISFKNTVLFKRGIWLSAAALIACVAAPSVLDGDLRQNPAPSLFAVAIVGAFFVYFLKRTQIHRLADEVQDCGDHLRVRRGRTETMIRFSNIAIVDVAIGCGIPRITVRLLNPMKLGGRVEFLPQGSLWSRVSRVKRVAADLTDRAHQAHERP